MSSLIKEAANMKQTAGCMPYVIKDGIPVFMFMVPSDPAYGGDKPSIAKGNIDPGESVEDAAIREASEELGLKKSNITVHYKAFSGAASGAKNVYTLTVYAAKVKSELNFKKPHYETGSVHWLTAAEFAKRGRKSQNAIVQHVNQEVLQHEKFDLKKNKIYIDLDGVLADFDKFIHQKLGKTFDQNSLVQGDDKELWDAVEKTPHVYAHLDPTPYAKKLWKEVTSYGVPVEVLTAIPRRSTVPSAEADKREWVKKHLGPHVKMHIGPYSKDKWRHAKSGDILIDDRKSNIADWIAQGDGIGILHDYENGMESANLLKKVMQHAKSD